MDPWGWAEMTSENTAQRGDMVEMRNKARWAFKLRFADIKYKNVISFPHSSTGWEFLFDAGFDTYNCSVTWTCRWSSIFSSWLQILLSSTFSSSQESGKSLGKHEWEDYEPHREVAYVALTQNLLMDIKDYQTQINYGTKVCNYLSVIG